MPGSGCDRYRCILYKLAWKIFIQFLPDQCDSPGSEEQRRRRSNDIIHSASVATAKLVPLIEGDGDCPTTPLSSKQMVIDTSGTGRQGTPSLPLYMFSNIPLISSRLQQLNISERAQDIIMSSWRPGTSKQYYGYLKKWKEFAIVSVIDLFHPSVMDVLQFLSMLLMKAQAILP